MSVTPPPFKNDKDRANDSANITHTGMQKYKQSLFDALQSKYFLIPFVFFIYLIKIAFCLCLLTLLTSYIAPDFIEKILYGFDKEELQDFLLKIIAGGFFNQLFSNVFGKNKEK